MRRHGDWYGEAPCLIRRPERISADATVQFDHREYFRKSTVPPQPPPVISSTSQALKLSQDQIKILKCSGEPDSTVALSTFSAVAAHVWKGMCKARGRSPETDARLIFVVDIRNRVCPPLPQQYLGNAFVCTSLVVKVHDVLSESPTVLARKIKGAIDRVDDSYVRSAINCIELMDGDGTSLLAGNNNSASMLRVVSWLGMPTMGADFGWGPPKFMVRVPTGSTGIAYLKNDDAAGVSVMTTLETETMARFKDLFYDKLSQFGILKNLSFL